MLCIPHAVYLSLSGLTPNSDESHYLSGAFSIAGGLKTGTLSGAWNGYRSALGYKAPLICIPAGILMAFTDSLRWPVAVQVLLTFIAIGLAGYSLFRNCFSPFHAAMAATIVLCSPLVTGLTHHYYVELPCLLLTIVLLDILVRMGWRNVTGATLIGLVLGLGVLCKVSFPGFVVLPILFSLGWHAYKHRQQRPLWLEGSILLIRSMIAGAVTALVAWPWYSLHWKDVLEHAQLSARAISCYYPGWIAADLSVGPTIPVLVLAIAGLPIVVLRLIHRQENSQSLAAWTLIFLVAANTALVLTTSVNKCTRFSTPWLPLFPALAIAFWRALQSSRAVWLGPVLTAGLAVLLSLNNSFAILPFKAIRIGDLRILDSKYPLNVPGWWDDDAPLDRNHYPFAEVEQHLAEDAAMRFKPEHLAEARTVEAGLLMNFDYFALLASLHKHQVRYLPWWVTPFTQGLKAPDYIVDLKGFDVFYPGIQNFRYYEHLEEDVAKGKIPYVELFRIPGPGNSRVTVFVKK